MVFEEDKLAFDGSVVNFGLSFSANFSAPTPNFICQT